MRLGGCPPEVSGREIVGVLRLKGFCVVEPGLEPGLLEEARGELRGQALEERWQRPHRLVQAGLLGPEGSATIAELDSPEVDEEARTDGQALARLDARINELGLDMEEALESVLGIQCSHRTMAVAHLVGEPEDGRAPLAEREAQKWLGLFIRHRVMVLVFLGPTTGTLELKPYDTQETEVHEIVTTPGMIVVLRPDLLSHRHFAPGRCAALSTFFVEGHLSKRPPRGGWRFTPEAEALNAWCVQRMQALRRELKDDSVWDLDIPRDWQTSMNHLFFKGQMIAVRGAAFKVPGCDVPEDFWKISTTGPDLVTSVPLRRWDHALVYDADLESWRQYKTCCSHAAFVDGIELFDCRMFGMTPNEAKSMDPHQRLILEVGYSSLHNMGMRKNTLVNTNCGVYVGCGNTEWNMTDKELDFGAFGATGGALSISSGRFSFTLGLKGPSMTLDTEGSSGATAVFLGAESLQRKGRGAASSMACAIAAHLLLTPIWWPSQSASGWLSPTGRCLTFDASADGYVRSDGVAAVGLRPQHQVVDGRVVPEGAEQPCIGSIAGAMMNNNGCGASLAAPHGPSEQEAIAEAIRSAGVSPLDVDSVEAHATGAVLSDAVEVGSIARGHRSEQHPDPVAVSSVKSSVGNQVEVGGITGFIKTLYAMQWGTMTPSVHLMRANPHMDLFSQPCGIGSECLDYKSPQTFAGVLSRGFGGSNVYLLAWGELDEQKAPPLPPPPAKEAIQYWPGGGGSLDAAAQPAQAYRVVGTWSQWREAHRMEAEGDDTFGFTVTLGENRWEQFQIWLDGDPARALHPGAEKAPKETPVYGPEEEAHGLNWLIDGRGGAGPWVEATSDTGLPGDQYRVQLRVAGKWRTVTWQKLESQPEQGRRLPAPAPAASYYVAGSWCDWELVEMAPVVESPGLFRLDVALSGFGGEFQIVRNLDWAQVFYPDCAAATLESDAKVWGPDDWGHGYNWSIAGNPGDAVRIEFRRVVDADGGDARSVAWRRIGGGAALPP